MTRPRPLSFAVHLLLAGCAAAAPRPSRPTHELATVAPAVEVDPDPVPGPDPEPALSLDCDRELVCRIRRVTERVAAELAARSDRDAVMVCLRGPSADDLATLARVPWLKQLGIVGFKGGPLELRKVPRLGELRRLEAGVCHDDVINPPPSVVADALDRFPRLEAIVLYGKPLSDLAPLRAAVGLREIGLYFPGADLGPMAGHPTVEKLTLGWGTVSLATLATLPALRTLSVGAATDAEVAEISKIEHLRDLALPQAHAKDVSPLGALGALERLSISCNHGGYPPPPDGGVALIPPDFAKLTRLVELNLDDTGIRDLELLAPLARLRSLKARTNGITRLDGLASLASLETLRLDRNPIESLEPLEALAALRELSLHGTRVTSLAPLAKNGELRDLLVNGTRVTSLSSLAKNTRLQRLDVSFTGVTDLGPLVGLKELRRVDFHGTRVRSLRPLVHLPALRAVGFGANPGLDLTPLAECPALESVALSAGWDQIEVLRKMRPGLDVAGISLHP